MHVVLISNCEKKAIKKTRAVLDSYALRSGEHTWMTRITIEGLRELHTLLRRSATRQTSVACFRNDGRKQMRLLWIVGNQRNFDRHGISPVATQARKNRSAVPEWARVCSLISSAAGHMHDFGKFGRVFQDKLKNPKPTADPVRHEWLSLLVVREMIDGATWQEAWSRIASRGNAQRYKDTRPFDDRLRNAFDAVQYLIATHHKLPGVDGSKIGSYLHVRNEDHKPQSQCDPSPKTLEIAKARLDRLKKIPENDHHLYWRAIATISRMALILADHSISAETHRHKEAPAYANTIRSSGELNQDLDWHLENVGRLAGDMVFNMLSLSPPALSMEAVERICIPATGRFAWQEVAVRALTESNREIKTPHLVLNMAGTGSGKTRANARMICALNEDNDVRFATVLNLRTLTLQTEDAYSKQLGIGNDEMACVIGDRLARDLHEYQKSLSCQKEILVDDDENSVEDEIETISDFEYIDAPEWLRRFTQKDSRLKTIIGAPVLVSTIDFLISAGEPHRQGHHALASLRLMTSDLILDEIDGYEPMPLLAVLRMIIMAALFGRNVIASSATLSRPVARLLWKAYSKGAEMREKLTGSGNFKTAIIDDLSEPLIGAHANIEEFMSHYNCHVDKIVSRLAGKRTRIPFLQRVESRELKSWGQAVFEAVSILHKNQAWVDAKTDKKISIGLVRMANVRPAIETAKFLAEKFPYARVACYHANHFVLQRYHIEHRLDKLLSRKDGDTHITSDSEIRALLDNPDCSSLMLIVVATPVEEIGRDHDFDWAVIEPSSSQSIVQTAGRVNRHRLISNDKPNVAIMQFNWRYAESKSNELVFHWPGYETKERYPTHDLAKLFDWSSIEQIDARMRFDIRHSFAEFDDKAIDEAVSDLFLKISSDDPLMNMWMALDTYTRSPLRDKRSVRVELTLMDSHDSSGYLAKIEGSKEKPVSRIIHPQSNSANAWLNISDHDAATLANEIGISPDDALFVSIPFYGGRDSVINISDLKRHLSFGFYKGTNKK